MTIYKEKIVNGLTGEETWRDYTAEEIATMETQLAESKKIEAEVKAKAAAKASALAKLAALGLSADEIAAL